MAELVFVLALFEKVLQQLFDILLMVDFSKTMVSLDRHAQVSSHFPRELCLRFLAVSTESEEGFGRPGENFDQLSKEQYEVLGLGKRRFPTTAWRLAKWYPRRRFLTRQG